MLSLRLTTGRSHFRTKMIYFFSSKSITDHVSIFPTGLGSLAASYLNPVKSFVPQMPKLLKSLFPVRDEKKGRQTSPLAQQVKYSIELPMQ